MTCDIGHTWDRQGSIPGVLDTSTAWYARLPGMDPRDLSGDKVMISKFFAFMCAGRIVGMEVAKSRSNSKQIQKQGTNMFWWLYEAPDALDGYARRVFLGEACEQQWSAQSGTRIENYLQAAQWAYQEMTGMTMPDSIRRSAAA